MVFLTSLLELYMDATEKTRTKLEIKDMSFYATVMNTYFFDFGTRFSKRLLNIILVSLANKIIFL